MPKPTATDQAVSVISSTRAARDLREILDEVARGHIVLITHYGRPRAVLAPVDLLPSGRREEVLAIRDPDP